MNRNMMYASDHRSLSSTLAAKMADLSRSGNPSLGDGPAEQISLLARSRAAAR
jgi:hypothetical protein